MNNKITLSLIAFAAITYTSCTGSKCDNSTTDNSNPQDIAACADIKGQWTIETIALSDSDYIRPAEQVPGVRQYITFEDSTYFIKTNCNSFSGTYTIKGDSITLGDGAMTEMACDNMVTEDAIRQILPNIAAATFCTKRFIPIQNPLPSYTICSLLYKSRPHPSSWSIVQPIARPADSLVPQHPDVLPCRPPNASPLHPTPISSRPTPHQSLPAE